MTIPFTGLTGPTRITELLDLSESEYAAGLSQAPHSHEPAYLTHAVAGGYEERTAAGTRQVSAGALVYHPSGERHAVRFGRTPTRVFRLRPLPSLHEAARLAGADLSLVTGGAAGEARAIVARAAAVCRQWDPLAPLTLDALACELVVCCAAARSRPRASQNLRAARRALELLEAHPGQSVPLARLAAEAGCHPVTLARAFRRACGCSIGQYARRRRLEEACRMLTRTDLGLSTVAARTGFADQAHLTRVLRRCLGLTPRTFRLQIRQADRESLRAFKTPPGA